MDEPQVGRSRPRREDATRLTGAASYTDDVAPADAVFAAVRRCPYGHARVEEVTVDAALDREGVVAAFGAADLADAGGPTGIATSNYFPGPDTIERPLLVADRARFSGDPVAVVLAEERYVAHAALDDVDVAFDRLPAVTDPREAAEADAPVIGGEGVPNTTEWATGDEAAVERALDRADHHVSAEIDMPRLISAPMEPRAVLAEPAGSTAGGSLTVTTSTQTPHADRDRIAETLGRRPADVRVVVPAVGGGFGPKGGRPYPEGPLVAWCAEHLDRPVKWVATRSEGHRTDHQGRGVSVSADLAVTADGDVRALRIRGYVGIGGYPLRGPSSAVKPNLLTGAYDIPAVHCRMVGALTNTAPLGPYRGAGRPEAIFIVERLIRRAATALSLDPAALRRRNFVPPEAFPYETAGGYTYDSGDYATALDRVLDAVGYERRRREQASAREAGRSVGIGLASFVENTGSSSTESARVEIDADGRVTAFCGTADQGQGHETAFAQLLADELGVPFDDVAVVEGDTDTLERGTGTFGCRSVPVGASGLVECARDAIEVGRPIAARDLEADPADIGFEDGTFHVEGAPDRRVSLARVAGLAAEAGDPLVAERDYELGGYVYTFGTHAAVVEVDPDTGEVDVRRYVAIDDCGVQINPTLVEGQVHGAVAQGLGQARCEAAVYDETGTLQTGSFQDYALPRAATVPELETGSMETPSPMTPHGAKGIGEGGTIAAPPAVVNAVVDALEPLGVDDVPVPVTPEAVWRAIASADGDGR